MSDDKKRSESSLLYSAGNWRPPGSAGPLPTPLNPRPASGLHGARPWVGAGVSGRSPAKGSRPPTASKIINEETLFDGFSVIQNAMLNSQTVEERALEADLNRRVTVSMNPAARSRPASALLSNFYQAQGLTLGAGAPRPSRGHDQQGVFPGHVPPIQEESEPEPFMEQQHAGQPRPGSGAGFSPYLQGQNRRLSSAAAGNGKQSRPSSSAPDPRWGPPSSSIGQRRPSSTPKSRPASAFDLSSGRPISAPRVKPRPSTATATAAGGQLLYGRGHSIGSGRPPSPNLDEGGLRRSFSGSRMMLGGWGDSSPNKRLSSASPKHFRPTSAFSQASAMTRTTHQPLVIKHSVADQPVYNDVEGEVQTAQDVVDYFTTWGHSATKKLFYLNKRKPSSPYDILSPFDLVVVPHSKAEREHYTMSTMGVVHITDDGEEGEFMELGEWMRLQSIYGMLRKMRFFRNYYISKGFRHWHMLVRRVHFRRVRTLISRRLYPVVPVFQPCMREVHKIVYEMQEIDTTSIENRPDKIYMLSEFVERQNAHREERAGSLVERLSELAGRITGLINDVATRVEAEKMRMESMADIQELRASNFAISMPSSGGKGKSISQMREERQALLNAYNQCCDEVERLHNLVRLVDYMVSEAYVALVIKTARDILNYFEDPNKIRGVFSITVMFGPTSGFTFTPNSEEVDAGVAQVIDSALRTMHELPRPLTSKQLTGRYLAPGETMLHVYNVALAEPQFQSLRAACLEHVEASYQQAAEYVQSTFEDKRPIDAFMQSWDPSKYEESATDLAKVRKDLILQRKWARTVDQMKMSQMVGILFVDSKVMRSNLHTSITAVIETMKAALAKLARGQCQGVLEEGRRWNRELDARPSDLDGYAAIKVMVKGLWKTKEELIKRGQGVDDMYDTLRDYGFKVEIKDQVALESMHEALAELKHKLDDAEAWLDERATEMRAVLGESSTKLSDNTVLMLGEMTNEASGLNQADSDCNDMLGLLVNLEERLLDMEDAANRYVAYQQLLGEPVDDFGNLLHCRREFDRRKNAWNTLAEWQNRSNSWLNSPVETLNAEEVQGTTEEYFKTVYKMCKMYREDMVVVKTKDLIDDFKVYLPLFAEVGNPAMKPHHWEQVFAQLGVTPPEPDYKFTVYDLVQWGIMGRMEALSNISAAASKEYSLRKALDRMKEEWADMEFHCVPFKDTDTCVIGQTDEMQMLLDDQLMKIQAMNASPFVKPFKQEAVKWEQTLVYLQELLDQWIQCQSTWMYLEPIFSSPDIVKQMPEEGSKFSRVDTSFRGLMEEAQARPSCIPMAGDPERLEALRESNKLLEEVQKGLAAYLEKKRLFFPRFFFLSNDEMLEILSETKDPTRVQPHLRKCFEGIHRLRFRGAVVEAMTSVEGEVVPFKTLINTAQAKGAVERWLLEVEERMFEAVHDVTGKGIAAYPAALRHEWVLQWPGMAVLVVTGMFWTRAVERAIQEHGVQACEKQCTADLMKIVDLVRGELTGLQRATLGALVVMDVHARDVVSVLAEQQVTDVADFSWQAQLRTYWDKNTQNAAAGQPEREFTVRLRMMSSVIEYGYEYLGNSSRLVITPLTDRCYRTLMGAIHMNLGGAPEGPAGTGKTETTKDLAKALARQCVVFNCSDSLDYIAMGKFFKGLAASGAWACFDEFNRIDLEVLSVVAQQVMDIQRAIAAKLTAFTFEGTDMQLKWSAWCAITMNPGYAGRSELPDNLKALFRTVAMMVPDYAMIAEIILFSYGYLMARECAKKIVQCYKLCSEQLSSQDHYDYGMRAVMAVLRAAGNLKRRFPQEDEFVLMLRSIMDVNLCKFLSHDVPLFEGIISDLFPGVVLPAPDYQLMNIAIREACAAQKLQPTDYFMLKTIQLYEMIIVRHGLMLVGQPFSGKTCSLRVLCAALCAMAERGEEGQEKAYMHCVNPKSITMGQLYGQFDPVSHEWSDGVLAVMFRKCANDSSTSRKWLVLDGPVDAIWIENMNTVLDDNKKLCLNSGEIIQMSVNMNMIFEVGDLAVASPATVSRCGMVYLEPHQLGVTPLLTSWLAGLPPHFSEAFKGRLEALFKEYGLGLMRFIRKEVKESSPTMDANLAQSWMRLFSSLALPLVGTLDSYRRMGETKVKELGDALFLMALTWSLGCSAATEDGRRLIDQYVRAAITNSLPDFTAPSGVSYYTVDTQYIEMSPSAIPPDTAPLHAWVYDTSSLEWKKWTDIMDATPIPSDAQFKQIIVPTADSTVHTYLLKTALDNKYPILFVGPTGTGKTAYTQQTLLRLSPEAYTPPNFVGFSARTSANTTQALIDAKLDKRRKGVYGPPPGKTAVVFVDDLNMPQKEVYGSQPPIELLRQFMDHGGWYDRDNTFRHMQDVLFVTAMGTPGGGRTFITNRYTRHFHLVSITDPSVEALTNIFRSIQDWFLNTRQFPAHVCDTRDKVISATMEIYTTVMAQLLPTPTKSHYTFNLRDFSRVVQGLQMQDVRALMASAEVLGTNPAQQHVKLWAHEVLRVFYDRLVDEKEQAWFLDLLKKAVHTHFHMNFDNIFAHLLPGESAGGKASRPVGTADLRRLFFGDYTSEMDERGEKPYVEVTDVSSILGRMEEYLMDYNSLSKRPMNLAMFLYAVEHISRIARVLRQEGGHMLCVGVGGSGRQSLARLAAFICGMETSQVEISRNYGVNEWHEDLKKMCKRAGADNKPTVFLFADTQIKQEVFVEDINNLLNTGEVPNMFPYDERAGIGEAVRPAARKAGRQADTPSELWAYFVERCRANLHLVLCFSPIGDSFRDRLRQFPSLINCCTIDWFQQWPEDALDAVAVKFLSGVDVLAEQRRALQAVCRMVHTGVTELSARFLAETGRRNYVTPTSYLELISMFTTLLNMKRAEVLAAQHRYEVGLDKLEFTAGQVETMRGELRALQPVLKKTVGETEVLLKTIQKEKAEVVEPKKAVVDEEVKQADVKARAAREIKEECEGILAKAMPALNAAIGALDTIKAADIRLVASFKNPPSAVKLVMEAVCVMLDVKPTMVADPNMPGKKIADYWDASKKILMDTAFLNRLKEYDRDNIPPRIMDKIRRDYLSDPEFTPDRAAQASSAAAGMCKWVHAMDSYDKVAKVVAPKRAALQEAEAQYEEVMKGLRAKQAELQVLMDKLATLERQLAQSMKQKEKLEGEVEMCTLKLERAEKLISGLGGEKDRWTECAHQLRGKFSNLTGDMIVAAAVISYLGAFTAPYRESVVQTWVKACQKASIPSSPTFSLASVLGDPVKVRAWVIAGLPNDTFSIDNAIMLDNARRWPLMIDPQKQANKWVKNMEAERRLQVIKLTDADYMRTLENAIQFGTPVLLENVGEELDPSLEPLLLKQVFKSGGVQCLKLGDNIVEFSPDFRFYITTALRNPHYLPETAVKVTLLNFMITQEGLADQLLGVVVAQEMPDLEEQRQQLVVTSAENKKKLKEIEDEILRVLSSSEGNILEDATAVQILGDAKKVSDDIQAKQAVAEETQAKIDAARKGYRTCGDYNAVLFFCIADLAGVDAMYQYSLGWFIGLFIRSIAESEPSDMLPRRLDNISNHFTYALYCNVCRSLFEKDKLLFAFLLATKVLQYQGKLPPEEYDFILTNGVSLKVDEMQLQTTACPDWIQAKVWADLMKLPQVNEVFDTLPGHISMMAKVWKAIMHDSAAPYNEEWPSPFDRAMTDLQKLLVLRVLRPDKLAPGISHFVSNILGQKFVEPPPFDLQACFSESSSTIPLLFVLSPGTDPTAALLKFAEEHGAAKGRTVKLQVISMGQGQGPKAAALIEDSRSLGAWVLLQNCHLAPSWMPSLERVCEGITAENTDDNFRLWMTSMPSQAFPPTILQNCVKMTNEPPVGLRANMRRCLMLDPLNRTDFWEGSSKEGVFKNLLFGLVFAHAFVQERRRFGPIGWNIPYGFDDGDLRISARQLRMYVDENKEVPFAALRYAIGECNYGGRVTDDKDRRLMMTLMDKIYSPAILQERFALSESGVYYVPPEGPLASYQQYVDSLPLVQQPEAFGLHLNADISKDLNEAEEMITSLLATSGGGGSAAGGSSSHEKEKAVAAIVRDILGKLPPDFDIEAVQNKFPISYSQSMNQVLSQEMLRYNRLLEVIRSSLQNLDRALQGLQVLSAELEGVQSSLGMGRVPALWKAQSFPSLKPLASYVQDLLARLDMLNKWYQQGQPAVFWLSGFFFTPSFTTAVLQNFARLHKLPIDTVGFDFEMVQQPRTAIKAGPTEGVYVYGLYLEGCAWDAAGRKLAESKPKVLHEEAPVIWLKPARVADLKHYPHYDCPVYRTGDRRGVLATTGHSTNFLMMIKMPTDKPPEHWILRGVCMLCSLSD